MRAFRRAPAFNHQHGRFRCLLPLVLGTLAAGADYEVVTFQDGQVRGGYFDESAGALTLDDGSTIAVAMTEIVSRETCEPNGGPSQVPPPAVHPRVEGSQAGASHGPDHAPPLVLRLRELQQARRLYLMLLAQAASDTTDVSSDLMALLRVTDVRMRNARQARDEALDELRERLFPGSGALLRRRQEEDQGTSFSHRQIDAQLAPIFIDGVRRITVMPAFLPAAPSAHDGMPRDQRPAHDEPARQLVTQMAAAIATPDVPDAGWVVALLSDPERMGLLAGLLTEPLPLAAP